ncbi:hypothetical protein WR25_02198 [Diploscapter pachys]|uniref:Uncharacterized protein n=1 Tax=Diploscapter pachys TaxID=2018661 RepID=A0A2A2J9I1_9BILA|nr:hypothetical protein WR25_02198 [Diploscapter pachys]
MKVCAFVQEVWKPLKGSNDELAEEHHITRRRRESATSEPFTLKNQKRSVSLVIPRNTMLMDSMKNATDDIRLNLYNIESPPQASRPPQESRAMPRVPSSIEEMIQEVKTQINGLEELVGSLVEM